MQATFVHLRARRESRGDEGGFTLIELLIVVVILGILAAIVVFAVRNFTGSASQSSCRTDYKIVETAVVAYDAQMVNYPSGSATQDLDGGGTPTPAGLILNTDNQVGAPVWYRPGFAPAIAIDGTITQAAAEASDAAWNSETVPAPNAVAAPPSELLVAGNTLPNTVPAASSHGPWLKDPPINVGHYSIFVTNDGTGTVSVLDANGHYMTGGVGACSGIH